MKYACVFLLILEESDHYGSGSWKVSAELGANNKRPGGGKEVVIRSQVRIFILEHKQVAVTVEMPLTHRSFDFLMNGKRHDAGP